MAKRGSDHRSFFVSIFSSQETYRGSFRVDKRFLLKPLVRQAIIPAWTSSLNQSGAMVVDKLRRCRKSLSNWKKENNFNSFDRLQSLKHDLEVEQSSSYLVVGRLLF